MKPAVIACSSLRPELQVLADRYGVRVRYLEMGLHQRSAPALRAALQEAIDAETQSEAVALAYGLCNRGIIGLVAGTKPVAVPRAHDCIAILLGRERYLAELAERPGTYFTSPGWLEAREDVRQPDATFGPASNATRETLAERYGEDNADYLLAEFEGFIRHYDRLAFIASAAPGSAEKEREAGALAARRSWSFARLQGDPAWLEKLVAGAWEGGEFLVLQPGQRIVPAYDGSLIGAEGP